MANTVQTSQETWVASPQHWPNRVSNACVWGRPMRRTNSNQRLVVPDEGRRILPPKGHPACPPCLSWTPAAWCSTDANMAINCKLPRWPHGPADLQLFIKPQQIHLIAGDRLHKIFWVKVKHKNVQVSSNFFLPTSIVIYGNPKKQNDQTLNLTFSE